MRGLGRLRVLAASSLLLIAAFAAPAMTTALQSPDECLLPAGGSSGAIDFSLYRRPLGTVKALMVFVDFPDTPAEGDVADTAAAFDGAADWLHQVSYGKVDLQISEVRRWFRMPHPSTFYPYARGFTAEDHERYVSDAVRVADPFVNFRGYDLYYFVANPEADEISFSPTFIFGPASPIHADGATISLGTTFGADVAFWGFKVLDHETLHTFGLPDLYAFSGDQHRFVGGWDVMGDILGHAPDVHAWFKWQLGWLASSQIACIDLPSTTELDLSPLETPGGRKAIVLRTGTQRVTVAEYRTNLGEDDGACSTGILISTINSAVNTGDGPVRVNDAHPGDALPDGCTYGPDDGARTADDPPYVDRASGISIDVLSLGATARIRVTRTTTFNPPDVVHARSLSIRAAGSSRITISGRLAATPALPECSSGRVVRLQRFSDGAWVVVRTADTTSAGTWSSSAAFAKGRYRLVAPQTTIPGRPRHVCALAVSPTITIR